MELAWAAGFFDGEGWSTVNLPSKTSKKARAHVGISQKDTRPLERFVALFGGNILKPSGTSSAHTLRYTGPRAEAVMEALWPYLSEPKKEQWEQVQSRLKEVMPNQLPEYSA